MDAVRPDTEPFTIQVGGRPRVDLLAALSAAGVQLNAFAETLLEQPDFDRPDVQTLRIVTRTVGELGLPEGGSQSAVFTAALDQGLTLCPLVAGPDLRLALRDQADAPDSIMSAGRVPSGSLHVASAPVTDDPAFPKGFYLRVVDGVPWLRGYRCDDHYVWPPEMLLALDLAHRAASVTG